MISKNKTKKWVWEFGLKNNDKKKSSAQFHRPLFMNISVENLLRNPDLWFWYILVFFLQKSDDVFWRTFACITAADES